MHTHSTYSIREKLFSVLNKFPQNKSFYSHVSSFLFLCFYMKQIMIFFFILININLEKNRVFGFWCIPHQYTVHIQESITLGSSKS